MNGLGELLAELWGPLGAVTVRRMFGGAGVYLDGVIVGLLADDELYLKADAASTEAFDSLSLPHFIYEKDGKPYAMSYRRAPEAMWDDPEEAQRWGRLALEAALRGKVKRSSPARKGRGRR